MKHSIFFKKKSGFTLIELLVAVAIISFLSSVILVGVNDARAKARNSKRRQDLFTLRSAIETFYLSQTPNAYPNTDGAWSGECSSWGSHTDLTGHDAWIPDLAPTYISVLPFDPKPNGPSGCYVYRSDGIDYKLVAMQTVEGGNVPTTDGMRDPKPRFTSYAFYTPNASSW